MYKQTALSSIDSYKLAHADMFPDGMTKCYSNFTPRSMEYFNRDVPIPYKMDGIVFFGLQGFLQELKQVWDETFFNVANWADIQSQIDELYGPFCGPNGFNSERMEELWKCGYLPLEIKALPEGSIVPKGVPCLTITNTIPEFYWLPNFLETWLSAELWKASTTATRSYVYRKLLDKWAETTGGFAGFVQWQGHDFSLRGQSCIADGAKSGAGHLLSFTGTDNLPAVKYINDCYRGKETFVGGSVPASEHSVTTAGGSENELETIRRMIKMYPSGVVSLVADSYDYFRAITEYATLLKDDILARTPDQFGLAKVVFRPDSGDPVDIVCGKQIIRIKHDNPKTLKDVGDYVGQYAEIIIASETPHGECGHSEFNELVEWRGIVYRVVGYIEWNRYDKQYYYTDGYVVESIEPAVMTPEEKGSIACLWEIFGGTTNDKGYRTLNQRVGLIYGDSITLQRAEEIMSRLAAKGFASDNICLGIGSYTFQFVTRDTCGFAMKATYCEVNGEGRPIFKDPKTDSGTKKSAKGLLCVDLDDDGFYLVDNATKEQEEYGNLLKTVFIDGYITIDETFADIRARLGFIK